MPIDLLPSKPDTSISPPLPLNLTLYLQTCSTRPTQLDLLNSTRSVRIEHNLYSLLVLLAFHVASGKSQFIKSVYDCLYIAVVSVVTIGRVLVHEVLIMTIVQEALH